MKTKILIVEHDSNDIEMIQRELKKGKVNYIAEIVQTGEAYENALRNFVPDIILSDYSLPSFDGPAAFKIKEKIAPDTPFIFVSGTIGEENSIELIKSGVTDFVLKERLFTIGIKVNRALKEVKEKKEKSNTARALVQSEGRLARAQQIAHIGSWELNFATGIAIWSDEACRIYGFDTSDNQHSFDTWISFVHPDDAAYVMKLIKTSQQTLKSNSFDHRIIRKDGTVRHIHSESKFELDSNGKPIGLYGTAQDVTAKKEAEQQLHKTHNRLLFLVENSPLGFIEWDNQMRVKSMSKRAEEILGWCEEEFINMQKDGPSIVFKEDLPAVLQINRQLLSGEKKRNSIQHRNYTKNGAVIWCEWFNSAMKDKEGNVDTILSLVQDITGRKETENQIKELNERLEERVQERTVDLTEANKALEAFNSMVSHDLRAPARAVSSFSKIIQEDYGTALQPQVMELFGYIEDSCNRMNAIIDDLLKLSKYGQEKLKLEPVDMTRLVNGIWLNISRNSPHTATLELEELCNVKVDMSMIQQVLVNLLSNAIKYSSKKEKPVIKVWCKQVDENCTFYFKDNGAGFDMKNYARLFGAFQRFHNLRDFEGTGVGLTLVKRIIEKHGGTVGAEGKVGEGATFWFTLPLKSLN